MKKIFLAYRKPKAPRNRALRVFIVRYIYKQRFILPVYSIKIIYGAEI